MTGEQKTGGLEVVAWRKNVWVSEGIGTGWMLSNEKPEPSHQPTDIEPLTPAEPAEARIRELEAELEQYRSAARDHNDIWWKTVIGETHQPSGEGISVKHLHPLTVKPFYDQHKGTAIADIIAGLIFEASITRNRERFLVEHANDRATAAEAKLARAVEGLERIASEADPTRFIEVPRRNLDRCADIAHETLAALQQEWE